MMCLSVLPEKDENLENAIDSHGQMRFFDELGRKCDTFSNLSKSRRLLAERVMYFLRIVCYRSSKR
jgi:hypothetical protein